MYRLLIMCIFFSDILKSKLFDELAAQLGSVFLALAHDLNVAQAEVQDIINKHKRSEDITKQVLIVSRHLH